MISTGLGPNIVEKEFSDQNTVYKWNEIIQNIMHFLFRIREFAISFPLLWQLKMQYTVFIPYFVKFDSKVLLSMCVLF